MAKTASDDQRIIRDSKLIKSDWTLVSDSPLTTSKKAEWVAYRQALRDIPTQVGFPDNITWPKKPS